MSVLTFVKARGQTALCGPIAHYESDIAWFMNFWRDCYKFANVILFILIAANFCEILYKFFFDSFKENQSKHNIKVLQKNVSQYAAMLVFKLYSGSTVIA